MFLQNAGIAGWLFSPGTKGPGNPSSEEDNLHSTRTETKRLGVILHDADNLPVGFSWLKETGGPQW